MTSRDFCFWLQGFFELSPSPMSGGISSTQVDTIKRHLNLVFIHEIDPSAGGTEHQAKLNAAHASDQKPVTQHELNEAIKAVQKSVPMPGETMRC